MKHTLLLFLSLLLMAGSAWGAEQVGPAVYAKDRSFLICDAESATGTCDTAAGADLYAYILGFRQHTVTFSESGSGAVCDVYYGDQEAFSGLVDGASLAASDGVKLNSTQLSSSAKGQSFEAPFFMLWVICTVGTGTHTVSIHSAN